jgi:hypothetical protein
MGIGVALREVPVKPGILATLCRLVVGFFTGLLGLSVYLDSGWEGLAPSLFFSLMLVAGARWFLLGLIGFVMPLPSRTVTWGLAMLLMLVLGFAGPTVSAAYQRSQEPNHWKEVEGSHDPVVWQREYKNKVGWPFRRPGWLSRQSEAICLDALQKNNFETIRDQARRAFVEDPKAYDDGARKAISEAWSHLQAEGLSKVKPTRLAEPRLTAAFKKVLDGLAVNPARKVQLHFDAEGSLAALPQDKQFFADLDPKYKRLSVTAVGGAFSQKSHQRRAAQVQSALQSSFDAVWPKGMLSIVEAPSPKDVPGDVNFWVHAVVHRIPGFYTNSDEGKVTSLLYKCEVQWAFRITMDGKEIGKFGFRSEPARHVSYQTRKDDPEWAAYSIIMDSAADNFARLIVGRLGLVPPEAPKNYTFIQ